MPHEEIYVWDTPDGFYLDATLAGHQTTGRAELHVNILNRSSWESSRSRHKRVS